LSLYRVYIDEVGNHDMEHVEDPNQRFLALTGVILSSEHSINIFQPEFNHIKTEFFQPDPDEHVILHRKEIVRKLGPFKILMNPETLARFNLRLLHGLEKWDYRVITVVIDKKAHREQYQVWRSYPYHYCLKVLVERFVLFLHYGKHQGDTMVESRGGDVDMQLKDSYAKLYKEGTENIPPDRWQSCLTSKELKVKPKSANIAGLQLADLIAYPSRREILHEKGLLEKDERTFSDEICKILNTSKYHRHYQTGEIWGYGKKLLP